MSAKTAKYGELNMQLQINKQIPQEIFKKCKQMQKLGISSKKKVGCVLMGVNPDTKEIAYFGASNMETSISFTTHAEVIALQECLTSRYYPVELYVTSHSKDENVFLCGACRQQYLEVNEHCTITVFDPVGKIKGTHTVDEVLPFHKDVKEKNELFRLKCKRER